jgi:hypothetical protein
MMIGTSSGIVPAGALTEHPAVVACSEFFARSIVPERIDLLRKGDKSVTYRLSGVGDSKRSIIAQRARTAKVATERIVYEQILPHVPVNAPRFYGFKPDGPDHGWMFLEDVGDQRYGESDPVHRSLAGRWIGLLHSAASSVQAARSLPDGGPQRYLNHLRAARAAIDANLGNPFLEAGDVDLLRRMISDLKALEGGWAGIEQACAGVPATLAHGDFRGKNAYIRKGRDGLALFPIDWETAGWGVPATDLTRVDLPSYTSVIHACWWPDVSLQTVERLASVGHVFRLLAAIFWISPQLAYEDYRYLMRPIACLRVFQQRLADAVRASGGIT